MITVAELDYYNPDLGKADTLRLTSGAHYIHGPYCYIPAIKGSFVFRQTLYSGTLLEPSVSLGIGEITIVNVDHYDYIYDYGFDGREIRLWRVQDENSERPMEPSQVGRMTVPEWAWDSVSFGMESYFKKLDRPIQTNVFEPVTGDQYDNPDFDPETYIDGDPGIEGQTLPMVYGRVNNVTLKLLNQYLLLYSCNYSPDGSFRRLHNVWFVGAQGSRYEFEQDYATLADLLSATVQRGHFITCMNLGLIRLGTVPGSTVTADVSSAPDDECTVSDLVARVFEDMDMQDTYNAAELQDLRLVCPLPMGVYVTSDVTGFEVIGNLLSSINAWMAVDASGTYRFGRIRRDNEIDGHERDMAPVFTADHWKLGSAKIVSLSAINGVPCSKLIWNHSRNWTVQGEGSVLPSVSSSRRMILAESHQVVNIPSPQSLLDLHPSAEAVELTTLINGSCPVYLDNDRFEAGFVRWDVAGGEPELLPIGMGIKLKSGVFVTQLLEFPQVIGTDLQLQVTCVTAGEVLAIQWWTDDDYGVLSVNDPSVDPITYSITIPSVKSKSIQVRLWSQTGYVTVTRAQVYQPGLDALVLAEASRRHSQAASKCEGYEFTFPIDMALDRYCGTLVRVQDYRYQMQDGPTFQVIGRTEDWEKEEITLTLGRFVG